MIVAGNWPSSHELLYRIFLFHFFYLLPPYLSVPNGLGLFFLCSPHFLSFPSLIFVILNIHFHSPIQHFDLGFVSFFHFYLAYLIIPIIPLLLSWYPTTSLAIVVTTFLTFSHLVSFISSFQLLCCTYQNYCKIIKLSSHSQGAYSLIHCLKIHNCLFILPVNYKTSSKSVTFITTVHQYEFPVSKTPLPLHLVSWIAAVSILYNSSSVLTCFNTPALYELSTFHVAI